MRFVLLLLPLAACGNEANHLGNPLTWPGQLVGSVVSNGIYDARRDRVEAFVGQHQVAIVAEAAKGSGPALSEAMALAGVPAARVPELVAEVRRGRALYAQDAEALVVALMVHGV